MLSKKEQKRNLKRLEKGDTIKRRLIFLKRYVKKGYTVPKILSMLKANDLEIFLKHLCIQILIIFVF